MKIRILLSLLPLVLACNADSINIDFAEIEGFRAPKSYICERVQTPIVIDGILDDKEWGHAAWTDYYNDIEGISKPTPRFKTRSKMLWDNQNLYIAATLEEPHVWATITERDEVIFYDNDFEVFIDPDGDTHHYYELEINAFETPWDLLLTKPYRDGGYAVDSWDIAGLQVGVNVQGTINEPNDQDEGWTLEIAIPFSVLEECTPSGTPPVGGDIWRINFSRVEWKTEVVDGQYVKQIDEKTGKPFPEDNWVWSPQYHINMHMPEYWGFILFSDEEVQAKKMLETRMKQEKDKWILRKVYYAQVAYREETGNFASNLTPLKEFQTFSSAEEKLIQLQLTSRGFNASLSDGYSGQTWVIDQESRVIGK